ncbi:MAG TPA: hypothetical protein VFP12_04290 [Allosphingosinicella sp.]|nr:hypothetical protein [Allosphingosinicella sp.]
MLPRIALTALAATALVSTAATAAPAGFTLEMTGYVPTICHAQVQLNVASPGTLDEFCNNAAGYEIYAEHSPELAEAVLVVDGVDVPLSASGPTRVSRSDHADIATRSLELRLPDGRTAPNGTLSFRVVAL